MLITQYLQTLPKRLTRIWNPSEIQLAKLDALLRKHPLSGPRPSFEEYEAGEKTLSKKGRIRTLKGLKITNWRKGFGSSEIVPNPNFDAKKDLPEGLALFSMGDSGSNHVILNADRCIWTQIWNYGPWGRIEI